MRLRGLNGIVFVLASIFCLGLGRADAPSLSEPPKVGELVESLKDFNKPVPVEDLVLVARQFTPEQTDVVFWRLWKTLVSLEDRASMDSLLRVELEVDALLSVFLFHASHRSYFSEVITLERLFARKLYALPAYTDRWVYMLNQSYLHLVSQLERRESHDNARRSTHLGLTTQYLEGVYGAQSPSTFSELMRQQIHAKAQTQFAPSGGLNFVTGASTDRRADPSPVAVTAGFEAELVRPQFKIRDPLEKTRGLRAGAGSVDRRGSADCQLILDISGPPSRYRLN